MLNVYSIKDNRNEGNAVFDTHLHDEFEINFMLSEGVEVIIEDKMFISKKGDIFIFQPYTFHKIDSKNKPFSRYLLFFGEASVIYACNALHSAISTLKNSDSYVISLDGENIKTLTGLFEKAEEQMHNTDTLCDYRKVTALGDILSFIMPLLKKSDVKDGYNEKEEILRILSYINNNYAENLMVEDIAKKFGMSSTTLWHLMKNNLLMSPKEYIQKIRIAGATELLMEGASVTAAAEKSGFTSYSHFIRTFKKHIGISPYKYGKNNKKGM